MVESDRLGGENVREKMELVARRGTRIGRVGSSPGEETMVVLTDGYDDVLRMVGPPIRKMS